MTTSTTRQDTAPAIDQEYCDIHDAYYNPLKDEWLETACDDPTCPYCVGRPQRPSEVKKMDHLGGPDA